VKVTAEADKVVAAGEIALPAPRPRVIPEETEFLQSFGELLVVAVIQSRMRDDRLELRMVRGANR
jgi:hypothetical protein